MTQLGRACGQRPGPAGREPPSLPGKGFPVPVGSAETPGPCLPSLRLLACPGLPGAAGRAVAGRAPREMGTGRRTGAQVHIAKPGHDSLHSDRI